MYPADGSKLLVTSLMFCCGVPARRAAFILLCVTIPCVILFIGYSAMTLIGGLRAGYGGAAAAPANAARMCFCRGDGEKYPEACPVYDGEKHGQGHMMTVAEANAYRGDKNTTRYGFSCQKWTESGISTEGIQRRRRGRYLSSRA